MKEQAAVIVNGNRLSGVVSVDSVCVDISTVEPLSGFMIGDAIQDCQVVSGGIELSGPAELTCISHDFIGGTYGARLRFSGRPRE